MTRIYQYQINEHEDVKSNHKIHLLNWHDIYIFHYQSN